MPRRPSPPPIVRHLAGIAVGLALLVLSACTTTHRFETAKTLEKGAIRTTIAAGSGIHRGERAVSVHWNLRGAVTDDIELAFQMDSFARLSLGGKWSFLDTELFGLAIAPRAILYTFEGPALELTGLATIAPNDVFAFTVWAGPEAIVLAASREGEVYTIGRLGASIELRAGFLTFYPTLSTSYDFVSGRFGIAEVALGLAFGG